MFQVLEVCFCKNRLFGIFIIVISIYSPPNSYVVQFDVEFGNLMPKFSNETFSIASDFDINLINSDNVLNCITNLVIHSYKSHIFTPTHGVTIPGSGLKH